MALDQNPALWAGYQEDPTKAFQNGQWINGADYVNQFGAKNPHPGFGSAADRTGYLTLDNATGKPKYVTYEQMKAEGLGDPHTLGFENSGGEAGAPSSGTQMQGNAQMLAKYPMWSDPNDTFMNQLGDAAGFLAPVALAAGAGGLLGGAFGGFGGLGAGASGASEAAALTGSGGFGAGGFGSEFLTGAAGAGATTGGGMPFDFGSYDPSNPFGLGSSGGGVTTNLTGDFALGTGQITPYTGGLAQFPGLSGQVVNLAGGGLIDAIGGSAGLSSVAQQLAQKIGTTAAKSLMDKVLSGEATGGDLLNALGRAAPGLIGAFGSNQQGGVLQGIADRARGDRAPFLAKANEWLAGGPEAYGAGPGSGALKGVLARLSAGNGNPIGSGSSLSIASEAGLSDWRNAVTGMAGIGLGDSGLQAQLSTNAANASNPWPALGDAAASVFGQPKNTLEELLKKFGGGGADIFTSLAR